LATRINPLQAAGTAGDPLRNFPDFYQQSRQRSVIPRNETDKSIAPDVFQVAHGAFLKLEILI
jgi:hypothetical protein